MKRFMLAGAVWLVAICGVFASPELTVDKAAALAQQNLKDRGLEASIYVTSLAIQTGGIVSGEHHWVATWSQAIPGDDRKKEVGLRINMDGSIVRLVQGPGDVEALRNSLTRSDRPSIVDMKR